MADPWPHTAAILAGGGSRRMGERKDTIALGDGRTMIDVVASVLARVCARLVVVGASPALPELEHVSDRRPGQGPLGGIEALLASGDDTEYLVVPCDMPRLTEDLLRALLQPTDRLATVLRVEGEACFRPLPARVGAAALPSVTIALDAGRRAVRDLWSELPAKIVDVPASSTGRLMNVNTPEELERWRGA